MSLERRGKTLRINNWKFNQGGFKDGGSPHTRTSRAVLFSKRRAVKSNPSGFEIFLPSESPEGDSCHWQQLVLLMCC